MAIEIVDLPIDSDSTVIFYRYVKLPEGNFDPCLEKELDSYNIICIHIIYFHTLSIFIYLWKSDSELKQEE